MHKKLLLIIILLISHAIFADNIDIAFSPDKGSLDLVVKSINSAQKSICMATYSFTSKPVAEALIHAKGRGVDIKIVSDAKANGSKYTATKFLANHGVNVRLNGNYPIMHNKFIVIDDKTVETGSFNYSQAAAAKNAENVIVIWNNSTVASKYASECNRLFNEATPLDKSY